MKIANIILVHKNPEQVNRLVKNLEHPDIYNYIHIDRKVEGEPFLDTTLVKNTFFIKNRVKVTWGGYSILGATFSSMQEILRTNPDITHINVMSGQDYLIKPVEHLVSLVHNQPDSEFIEFESIERNWEANAKINKYHFSEWPYPGVYTFQRFFNFLVGPRKFPYKMDVMEGPNWMMLTRKACEYIMDFNRKNPNFYRYFRFVWVPEEVYIQTLIYNSPFQSKVVKDNFRYIDWSERKAHPKNLLTSDYQAMVDSGKIMARKFDIFLDSKIIDLLDQNLVAQKSGKVY